MFNTYTYQIENLGIYIIEKHSRNKYLLDLTKSGCTTGYKGKSHRTLQSAKEELLRIVKEDIEFLYTKHSNILDSLYQLDNHMNMEELEDYRIEQCAK